MNFVLTSKLALSPSSYGMDILDYPRTVDFYNTFPAPTRFCIPRDTYSVTDTQMQLLAIWFCRGTTLEHCDITIKTHRPRPEWKYSFTSTLPQYYITKGFTTPQKAYDHGKYLIDLCTKASTIPFQDLEEAYKTIMSSFWESSCRFFSPNKKTYLEVSSEKATEKEIEELTEASREALQLCKIYSDKELDLYKRIFGIETPNYCKKITHYETEHGYAKLTSLQMTDEFKINYTKNSETAYAGSSYNPNAGVPTDKQRYRKLKQGSAQVPFTLQLDEKPTPIHAEGLRAQLAEQVHWYLHQFKLTKDTSLLAPGWDYCEHCGFYQTTIGCPCHLHPSEEELELQQIKEAQENLALFYECYDTSLLEIARWAEESLKIEYMTNKQILNAVKKHFNLH